MPSVGLGVYKIFDEDMTKVVNAAINTGYKVILIQHTFMMMKH